MPQYGAQNDINNMHDGPVIVTKAQTSDHDNNDNVNNISNNNNNNNTTTNINAPTMGAQQSQPQLQQKEESQWCQWILIPFVLLWDILLYPYHDCFISKQADRKRKLIRYTTGICCNASFIVALTIPSCCDDSDYKYSNNYQDITDCGCSWARENYIIYIMSWVFYAWTILSSIMFFCVTRESLKIIGKPNKKAVCCSFYTCFSEWFLLTLAMVPFRFIFARDCNTSYC